MKKFSIRALSLILCLAMLVGYIVLPDVPAVQAETERTTTTTTATNPNLITNGTFEKVLADGTVQPNIEGWGLASSKVWSVAADPDKANNFVLELADNSTTASGSAVFTFTPEVGL